MFGLGGQELLLILLIILIFFGAKKLPELARGLGKGINEFKRAQAGIEEEINKVTEPPKSTDKDLAERVSQRLSEMRDKDKEQISQMISEMSDEEKAKLAELLNTSKKS